jgi:Flp pilus assembly protein TadG
VTGLRADRGNAIVEFALWLPLVLLALCSCMQLTADVYADRAARDAARTGVHAGLLGADPEAAARAALADQGDQGDQAQVIVYEGSVRVTLPVRQFLPWLPTAFHTASATSGGRP